MIWRNPLAWIGLATLIVPIAIHLLVRQQAQPFAFPSLRFLQASRLAAVKRRRLSDWLLLALRLLILAAAVAALADPFFVSAGRREAWTKRTTRAIVVDTRDAQSSGTTAAAVMDEATNAAVRAEQASAFASTVIPSSDLRSGVTRAATWLASAPPAAREVVVISPLTRGRVTDALRDALPDHVGLRFTRVGPTVEERQVEGRPASMRAAGGDSAAQNGLATRVADVTVHQDSTGTQWKPTGTREPIAIASEPGALVVTALSLRLETSPRNLAAARAALDAVLAEGVPVTGTPTGTAAAASAAHPLIITLADPDAAAERGASSTVGRLTSPWMADALQAVMDDAALRDAMSTLAMRGVSNAETGADSATTRDANGSASGEGSSGSASGNATPSTGGAASEATATEAASASGVNAGAVLVLFRAASGMPLVTAGAARASDSASAAGAAGEIASPLRIESRAPIDSDATALLIRAAIRAAAGADPLPRAEVARVSDAQLAAWQRPAALPPLDELTRVDTHDRRWFWGAALLLLLIERIVRTRQRRNEADLPEVAHAA